MTEELKLTKTQIEDLEIKEEYLENILQENNSEEMKLSSQVEQKRNECIDMKEAINKIQDSFSKKQEAITSVQAQILEQR